MHWFKQNKLLFSHVSVSLDDPRLVGYVRGIRLFLFFILFCKPCFLVLRFIVKDGSYPHSSLREREGLQTSRSHMETLPHTYYKEAKNVACLPRGEYRCWWTMKTQIKGRDWGHLKSVGGSLLKGAKSLWIVSISQLLNIWVYLPKLAKFNFSRIKKIDRFLVYF